MKSLRVVVMLKINGSGRWILPQVEELRRRGHEVLALLPPGHGPLSEELRRREFRVVDSPFNFRFRPSLATLRGLWRLRQLIRQLQPDVLNYHLYASALAARLSTAGLRLVRVHSVVGPLFLESAIIREVERWLWRLDDVIVCGTGYTSRRYASLGCPSIRRPTITCGVDPGHFRPTGQDAGSGTGPRTGPDGDPDQPTPAELQAKSRAELGLPPDAFVVVMVAFVYAPKRLTYHGRGIKGHDVLLTAWRSFHARHPRSHLLLVGGGYQAAGDTHRAELVQRFAVDEDPNVTWTESVADVRPYYLAADLSVSPSLSEGHGAAVEASAMAVPSIVSDAGGLPETVDDSSGWVVPSGDVPALDAALEQAYGEFVAGRLTDWGAQARRRAVRLFDNQLAAVRVAELIERTAERGRSR
jgi:glycosyltransferase involved in cell wall biosynthesis